MGERPSSVTTSQRLSVRICWCRVRVTPHLKGFTAPKVIWVRDNEPEILEKTATMLLPKDYVRFRLTGEIAAEVSDAAGTLLFDVRQRRWSEEVLHKLGIDPALLPPVYESVDICGKITAEVRRIDRTSGGDSGRRRWGRTTLVVQLATGLSVQDGFRQALGRRGQSSHIPMKPKWIQTYRHTVSAILPRISGI